MIDFPNSPVNGTNYDYQGIRYTYKVSGGQEGYWSIGTPGSIGLASIAEINAGTDPVKYITPLNLDGSDYARKTSPVFTGQPKAPTIAANDNSTKLATTEYVDRATSGGGFSETTLYSGTAYTNGTVVTLSESYNNFDAIQIMSSLGSTPWSATTYSVGMLNRMKVAGKLIGLFCLRGSRSNAFSLVEIVSDTQWQIVGSDEGGRMQDVVGIRYS